MYYTDMRIVHTIQIPKKQGREECWNHTLYHLFAQCNLHYRPLITQGFSVVRNHVFSGKELLMSVKTSPSKRALKNYSLTAQRQIWNLNIVNLLAIKTDDIVFFIFFRPCHEMVTFFISTVLCFCLLDINKGQGSNSTQNQSLLKIKTTC